ncbi:hypothetical protein OAV60_03370 [Paracoccaceae bacterium]|nr:hypothetical protein [Paracoccaceae bacterium]
MAISAQQRLHGAVIFEILVEVEARCPHLSLRVRSGEGRSVYYLDVVKDRFFAKGKVVSFGLYIKTSQSRRSPWTYSFSRKHQEEIEVMRTTCRQVFVPFINNDDGVACISYDELKELLDDNFEENEWITVKRNPGERYRLSGRDGELKKPLASSWFPSNIIEYLESI